MEKKLTFDKELFNMHIKIIKAYIKSTLDSIMKIFVKKEDLEAKQDKLTFDTIPTEDSQNPVTSEGIKSYVDSKVSTIPKMSFKVVDTLPTTDIATDTIYLLKNNTEEGNLFTEYLFVNNTWELLGTQKMDMSDYLKKDDFVSLTEADLQEAWGEDIKIADLLKY
jgi:hypothetical protein